MHSFENVENKGRKNPKTSQELLDKSPSCHKIYFFNILLKLKLDVCRSKNVATQWPQDVFLLVITAVRDVMLLKKPQKWPVLIKIHRNLDLYH